MAMAAATDTGDLSQPRGREEFVVVGWTDPQDSPPCIGAPLLGYYDRDRRLWRRLQPLSIEKLALDVPPLRSTRFGSPLVLSRVHWVRPELVAEVKSPTWANDHLLRWRNAGSRRRTWSSGCPRR